MNQDDTLHLLRGGRDGIREWNAWREVEAENEENSFVRIDLHDAVLVGANLTGANLERVDLIRANLRGALLHRTNLRQADLSGADLTGAVFYEAALRYAKLTRANLANARFNDVDLTEANLNSANLQGAELFWTDLTEARIDAADLTNATIAYATFACDLARTVGIESMIHAGPSWLSLDAALCFRDRLPERFLRGCGVRDEEIQHFRAQLGALQFYTCFISYASLDGAFSRRLYSDLQSAGVRCWFAPEDMKIGDKPLVKINEAITLRDKLILILSKCSIESDWVEHEVTKALEEENRRAKEVLFPIRLDGAVMECGFGWAKRIREAHKPEGRHIGDFSDWKNPDAYQVAFKRLLRDLRATSSLET